MSVLEPGAAPTTCAWTSNVSDRLADSHLIGREIYGEHPLGGIFAFWTLGTAISLKVRDQNVGVFANGAKVR